MERIFPSRGPALAPRADQTRDGESPMPTIRTFLTATAFAAALGATAVYAQTAPAPAAPPPAPTAAAPAKPTKAERTAKSKECSAQADTKGLHGKARKKF